MQTEVATRNSVSADLQEKVLLGGDLARLTPQERLSYYNAVCTSVGLNPLTRPFEYLALNGKLVLYARKDCTDQLRDLHGISVQIVGREVVDGCYVVTAQGKNMTERTDESIGAVPLPTSAADKANAMMKAETKAKRRVTLSICGLGMLDETEVDTISGAHPVPPPSDLETQLQASIDAVQKDKPEDNAPIDAAAPRGGETSEEEGLANEQREIRRSISPIHAPSEVARVWAELIALSESVREASATGNRIEADPAIDLFEKTRLREEVKQKILSLRAKKA